MHVLNVGGCGGAPAAAPVKPRWWRGALVHRESHEKPSWWRTALATLYNPLVSDRFWPPPVDHHVSNLEVERQVEFSHDDNSRFGVCAAAIRQLCNDPTLLAKTQRIILEQHEDGVGLAPSEVPTTGLMYYTRGPVGETLLHLAALFKLYDLFFWLVATEPLLAVAVYEEKVYESETVLHLLVAHMNLDILRRFAKMLLFWEDCQPLASDAPASVVGSELHRDSTAHSAKVWGILTPAGGGGCGLEGAVDEGRLGRARQPPGHGHLL